MVALEWLRGWSAFMALAPLRRLLEVLERHANPFTTDFRRCAGCGATPFEVADRGHNVIVDQRIPGMAAPWSTVVRADRVPFLDGQFEVHACPNACSCEPQCFGAIEHLEKSTAGLVTEVP